MAKHKHTEHTNIPDFVNVTANATFKWKYDKMYSFTTGQEYTVPKAIYEKTGSKLTITKSQPEPIIEEQVIEEIKTEEL